MQRTGYPTGTIEGLPGTCENIWGQSSIVQKFPSMTRDVRCDVCVIGGGVSGLSVAYRLAKAGKRVVVLEARAVGSGMSGRSLGMISSWNDDTYKTMEATVGNKKARMAAHAHTAAVSWVEGVVKTEGIDCGFHRLPGYLFEARRTGQHSNKAYQEFSACSRLGLMQAKMEHIGCGAGLTTGNLTQALMLPSCACLDPVKYVQGLATAVVDAGGKVFEGTKARGGIITGPHQGIVQIMDGGYTVQARDAVVLATHSPINRDQLWVHDRQLPRMSYTIGLEVPKGSVQLGQYYDLQGGHQMRLTPLPGSPDIEVLLVQAAMELYGSTGRGDPYAKLEAWARSTFPQAVNMVTKWSSHDYYPADLLGLYGQNPLDREQPANFILTGHSGQDITGATIGSEVVANSILQLPNPWAAAYNPSRFMLTFSAAAKYAVELTTYFSRIALYLGKHVVPRSTNDLIGAVQPHIVEDQIKPGDGMVVQHGWRKRLSGGMKREHFTSTVLCARTWAAVCLITLSTRALTAHATDPALLGVGSVFTGQLWQTWKI